VCRLASTEAGRRTGSLSSNRAKRLESSVHLTRTLIGVVVGGMSRRATGTARQCERRRVITTFIQRLIGAATLDGRTYEDVEADRTATGQAGLVVLLSSLAAGFGSVGAGVFDVRGIVVGTLGGVAGWVSWAALTYLIGTRVLPEPQTRANLGELLRTLAFAASPGLLRVVGAIPILRWPTFLVTALWMLLAMVVAVRHALDYRSTARAIGVCVLGWALSLAVAAAIGILFATPVS